MLFYVLKRHFKLREVEGFYAVPVLDAIFNRDFRIGEIEIVEM